MVLLIVNMSAEAAFGFVSIGYFVYILRFRGVVLWWVDEPLWELIVFVEEEVELRSFNVVFFLCAFGLFFVPLGSFCVHGSILIKIL